MGGYKVMHDGICQPATAVQNTDKPDFFEGAWAADFPCFATGLGLIVTAVEFWPKTEGAKDIENWSLPRQHQVDLHRRRTVFNDSPALKTVRGIQSPVRCTIYTADRWRKNTLPYQRNVYQGQRLIHCTSKNFTLISAMTRTRKCNTPEKAADIIPDRETICTNIQYPG